MPRYQKNVIGIIAALMVSLAAHGVIAQGAGNADSFAPGHHFGVALRIATAGDWKLQWEYERPEWDRNGPTEETETSTEHENGSLATTPGFGVFWEYLFKNSIVAPGLWIGVQFQSEEYYEMRRDLGTELQIAPRLRIFFARSGWWRPYVQVAAGFSFGIPSDWLADDQRDHVEYALAINTSGALGSLFAPRNSPVSFFIEMGIQGVFFWVEEKDSDDETEEEYKGSTRQLIISLGIEY